MTTLFGIPLSTVINGGVLLSLLTLIAGGITVWIKGIPDRLRVRNESKTIELSESAAIRAELHTQLDEMRANLRNERLDHANEMRLSAMDRDDLRDRLAKLEQQNIRQQIRHNAERALARHQLANINQCFTALLLLLKANPEDPDKVREAIATVEEMRANMLRDETQEKAIIRAAEIAADAGETDHDGC